MKQFLLAVMTLISLATPALANHKGTTHPPLRTINVSVNGLVCDFCARTLEKVFYQREGVEGVEVNLDKHLVKIEITETTTLPDDEITKMITDAGYNVTAITR